GPVLLVFYTMPGSAARLAVLDQWRDDLAQAHLTLLTLPFEPGPAAGTAVLDAAAAYRLYAGNTGSGHVEFLIDPMANLRARWQPGETPNWGDFQILNQQLANLAKFPLAPAHPAGHAH
ncbi:MAG TPA: hypothetical protein VKT70_15355, partial [Stellaceae bacterium]|nr:hypothetical protein [Stellaceae bacterium]